MGEGRSGEGRTEIAEYPTYPTYLKNIPILRPPEGAARRPWADGGETETVVKQKRRVRSWRMSWRNSRPSRAATQISYQLCPIPRWGERGEASPVDKRLKEAYVIGTSRTGSLMQTPTRISTGEAGQVGGEGFPPGANRGGRWKEGRKGITEYSTAVSMYLKKTASAKLEDEMAKLKT